MQLIVCLVFLGVAVQSCAAAWGLATTSDDDCPAVVDTNPGRGLDYECSTSGGESKGSAVLFLAAIGLGFGVVTLYGLVTLARGRTRSSDGDTEDAIIADDPSEPDEPSERRPSHQRRRDLREPMFALAVLAILIVMALVATSKV
jgi:hypothetical protein